MRVNASTFVIHIVAAWISLMTLANHYGIKLLAVDSILMAIMFSVVFIITTILISIVLAAVTAPWGIRGRISAKDVGVLSVITSWFVTALVLVALTNSTVFGNQFGYFDYLGISLATTLLPGILFTIEAHVS